MLYNSTENKSEVVSASQAIAQGISKDGGLFVPQELPLYDMETLSRLLLAARITRESQKRFSPTFSLILPRRKSRIV